MDPESLTSTLGAFARLGFDLATAALLLSLVVAFSVQGLIDFGIRGAFYRRMTYDWFMRRYSTNAHTERTDSTTAGDLAAALTDLADMLWRLDKANGDEQHDTRYPSPDDAPLHHLIEAAETLRRRLFLSREMPVQPFSMLPADAFAFRSQSIAGYCAQVSTSLQTALEFRRSVRILARLAAMPQPLQSIIDLPTPDRNAPETTLVEAFNLACFEHLPQCDAFTYHFIEDWLRQALSRDNPTIDRQTIHDYARQYAPYLLTDHGDPSESSDSPAPTLKPEESPFGEAVAPVYRRLSHGLECAVDAFQSELGAAWQRHVYGLCTVVSVGVVTLVGVIIFANLVSAAATSPTGTGPGLIGLLSANAELICLAIVLAGLASLVSALFQTLLDRLLHGR